MRIPRQILLTTLMMLSLQWLVMAQSALAAQLDPIDQQETQTISLPAESRVDTNVAASPATETIRFGPADVNLAMSGDDGWCCVVEILLLAGLIAVGVLGANLIVGLVKRKRD